MLPKHTEILWKIICDGLYVGERANNYQLNVKHVQPGNPILIPANCIYYNHQYNPGFQPRSNKPCGVQKKATLQHIMWESELAMFVWSIIFQLIARIGFTDIKTQYTNWDCIYLLLDEFDIKKGLNEILKINIAVQAIYQLYTTYKELQDRLTNKEDLNKPQLDGNFIDGIKMDMHNQLNCKIRKLIYLTPILNFLLNRKLNKNSRKREMMPLPYQNFMN